MGEAHKKANKNRKQFIITMNMVTGIDKIEVVNTCQMHQYITNLHTLKNINHISISAAKQK